MKKFRKIAALLAVTALVLTGCSGQKKETEKATEKATTVETQAAAETQAVEETAAQAVETEAAVAETEAEAVVVAETEAEAVVVAETEAEVVVAETEAEAVETEAAAAETEAEEVDFSAVTTVSDGKLIVGTEAGFAPYEYLVGEDVEGIDMDIAQAIADALGVELVVQNMDFDGALLAVQQGKVDIVAAGVSVSEERENVMDFSVKYVDSKDVILVNKADPKVEESTAEALEGKVVGVQQGNIADLWVSENAAPKSVQRYTKFVQAAQDLLNGKIDCIVMDEAPALELVASNDGLAILEGEALFEDSYAVAIKKGNEQMKAAVDAVITQLQESGQMDEIIASHSTASEGAAQTEAEAAQTEAE